MAMLYAIRRALEADAPACCQVVRRSITELCLEDHRGDEATIDLWLRNKTGANFEKWIHSDRHVAFIAEAQDRVVGFGLLNCGGWLSLLYVAPEVRFRGVSKALLAAVEKAASSGGLDTLALGSSATARRFYMSVGYVADGEPTKGFGVTWSYPMSKRLGP
jgi:GNAT superfamily N-acetyltransferase